MICETLSWWSVVFRLEESGVGCVVHASRFAVQSWVRVQKEEVRWSGGMGAADLGALRLVVLLYAGAHGSLILCVSLR